MHRKRKSRYDSTGFGFIAGALLPVIIFFAIFYFGEKGDSFISYIKGLWHLQALIKLGSLCVFANVAIFWIFIKLKFDKAARGILGATILYAFVVLISRAI